ncbi:MAG: c-type cytochrome [Methylovulum sp.]|nr:c-type cytochrome [Methylovulum sp.]
MHPLKPLFSVPLLIACIAMTSAYAADPKAGAQKATVCLGCHGPQGKSSNAQWPNLAAQQPTYIANQLNAYKSGIRENPMMQSIAANLGQDDINNLAAYFASLPAASAGGDPALASSGQPKAAMCLGCHGPSATGNGQFPRLAGQHPNYLVTQLKNFKDGTRQNSQMQAIAGSLSEEDMTQLAAYFGSL